MWDGIKTEFLHICSTLSSVYTYILFVELAFENIVYNILNK